MQIKLRKKEKEYAQVHKKLLFNHNLSLKAKGLGAILEAYSDNFEICMETLIDKSTDGIKAVKNACSELVLGNYLFRFQVLDEKSKFKTIWIFDSEFIDTNYRDSILSQFDKIYQVDEVPKGHPVSDGVPFQDVLKGTTYKNIDYKEDMDSYVYEFVENQTIKDMKKSKVMTRLENLAAQQKEEIEI